MTQADLLLRLAILADGALPEGWSRVHYSGADLPSIERVLDPHATVEEWLHMRRSCRLTVHHDGWYSIWGQDGPRQYVVVTATSDGPLEALRMCEAFAADWLTQPMGSPWPWVSQCELVRHTVLYRAPDGVLWAIPYGQFDGPHPRCDRQRWVWLGTPDWWAAAPIRQHHPFARWLAVLDARCVVPVDPDTWVDLKQYPQALAAAAEVVP